MKGFRPAASLGVLVAALGAALPAHATQYWAKGALLSEFFKTAAAVRPHTVTLPAADVASIAQKLGAPLRKATWTIYVAEDAAANRVGFALLDDEIGLHEPIDFGVRFGLQGAVERVEILEYREPYGDQVRGDRFRAQFVGKTAQSQLVAGKDIDIISGATYSSKAMTLGVKRGALILQAALKNGIP